MVEYSAYAGLDIHMGTISAAVALVGREDPVFRGEIRNQRSSLRHLIGRLSPDGEVVSFCYEVGSSGYGVYREIVATPSGHRGFGPHLRPWRSRFARLNCSFWVCSSRDLYINPETTRNEQENGGGACSRGPSLRVYQS